MLKIIIGSFILMIFISYVAASDLNVSNGETGLSESNLTCFGDSCAADENYTYEANLKDPKCWYKINFCNLDFPLDENTTKVYQVVTLLKQVNYQQQADVEMYKSKYEKDRLDLYFLMGFIVIIAIWNIYLLSKTRRLKNKIIENENK
jgi:hypothetical protein